MPEWTGFSPFLRLPDAPQDGLENGDFTNSPSNTPTFITEHQAEDRTTLGHHPASESNATPIILTPTEDYQANYPEEGVDDLAGNADYSYDYPIEFTPPEPPSAPPKGASGTIAHTPSDPRNFDNPSFTDSACSQNDFECADGSACLPSEAVCDGLQHCGDGSDEADCQHVGES